MHNNAMSEITPKTNAERQAAYRQRHLGSDASTSVRLDLVIDQSANQAFERMARSFGLSKRQTLEQLLTFAEATLLSALTKENRKRYAVGELNQRIADVEFKFK